jgi:acyl dehydratase
MTTTANLAAVSPALAEYYETVSATVGDRKTRHLGVVSELLIRRYAVAIGDANPIYHDRDAARGAGYDDIVAPPNMLAAIVDWSEGPMEEDLAPDGTPNTHSVPGLRVMGGGEEMELLRPVTANTDLYEEQVILPVVVKEGRSGPLLFVSTLHEIGTSDAVLYNRNRRTIIVRP